MSHGGSCKSSPGMSSGMRSVEGYPVAVNAPEALRNLAVAINPLILPNNIGVS
jgi:hypothetical protein